MASVQNFSTADTNRAKEAVQRAYFAHALHQYSRNEQLKTTVRTVDLGAVSVGLIRWGMDIGIECEYAGGYQINVVLEGKLNWERDGRLWTATPGDAAVFLPRVSSPITRWEAGSTILGIRVSEDLMNRHVKLGWAGREFEAPPKLDLHDEVGKSWVQYVHQSGRQIISHPEVTGNSGFKDALAAAVVTPLAGFLGQKAEMPHSPYMITRVRRAVTADLARAWRLSDLAGVAGVGPRRLQQTFKDFLGVTPTAWLLALRLERAHRWLSDPRFARSMTVSDIAFSCGFNHLGRFSQDFYQYFGQLPSDIRRSVRD